jgi:hypothetical protein
MKQRPSVIRRCWQAKNEKVPGGWLSNFADQIAHAGLQRLGNLHERIHRRRFFAALNPTDEDSRKPGFLRQFFLAETGGFTLGANGFTQQAAMRLADRHDQLKEQESENATMSLTTILLAVRPAALYNLIQID